MKRICWALTILILSACGQQREYIPVPIPVATAVPVVVPESGVSPVVPASPNSPAAAKTSVTVYSLTKPLSPGVNATAYCALSNGNTYCWDDGLHGIPRARNGAIFATYWDGPTVSSPDMATPTLVTSDVYLRIEGNTSNRPEEVFANGTATTEELSL